MVKIDLHLLKSLNKLIPATTTVVAGLFPFFIPFSLQVFVPDLMLCVLYFWGVYAPEKISLTLILIVGFIQESHLGLLFGTLALGNLIFFVSSLSYHSYLAKKPFILNWLIFGFIILLTSVFKMSFNSFILLRPCAVQRFLYEGIVTIFSYPAVASLCFHFHHKFH